MNSKSPNQCEVYDVEDTAKYNQIMEAAAMDAVRYVQKEYNFALDYSEQSIAELEKSLDHIHQVLVADNEDPIDPKIVVTLSNWYGAYMGEVFRRAHGGDWAVDDRDPEALSFEVCYEDLHMAFPSRIFHRIMGGEENNIKHYYDELMVQLDTAELKFSSVF